MATKTFLLPDLGEGLTEGQVVAWHVGVGDTVAVDQPVAEIETEKAVVEVPSPFEGTVAALHAEVGDEVEVGKPLLTVDIHTSSSATPAGPAATTAAGDGDGDGDGQSGSVLVGYGTAGRRARRRRAGHHSVSQAKQIEPRAESPGDVQTEPHTRPLAKPPVRKMAKDLGIDLADVPGSGPEGVVTREDIRAYAERSAQHTETEAPPAPQAADGSAAAERAGATERIPIRGVRKRVAEKMTISRREIPEATTWLDCDATALMELRDDLNASQDEVRVSPLAIILRICAAGLQAFPEINARLDTEANEIVLQRFVHLGFAAQTEQGLMVPVIKDADRRSLLDLAAELARLTAGARDGALQPEELTGGTFTVSNYGTFGVDGGAAVINHPQAAILGTGQIRDRPWVVDGALRVRAVMQLSIAFDHRICDGGEAAGFLRFVADCIESPTTLVGAL